MTTAHLCTGYLSGVVPIDFLRNYNYSQCNVCAKIVHNCYNGSHPKCRPNPRTQELINSLRSQINLVNTSQGRQGSDRERDQADLPSLSTIHSRFVPTIKNIPKGLRKLFAQCLTKALARVVWNNDGASWTELQMLPKCILCCPTRGGKSHRSQRLTWTRGRLNRWLAGERMQLWSDIPQY